MRTANPRTDTTTMPYRTDMVVPDAPADRGFCAVARRMLMIFPISSLTIARSLTLALITMFSGCVLPIGPEFEDPPSPLNYAPIFHTTKPAIGSVETVLPPGEVTFSITILDPNIDDELHVRWIANYPPYGDESRVLLQPAPIQPEAEGKPLRAPINFTPNCFTHNIPTGIQSHRLLAAVSDRPFLEKPTSMGEPLTQVPPDAFLSVAVWTLNMECRR